MSDKHTFGYGNPEYYLELFIDDFIILERYEPDGRVLRFLPENWNVNIVSAEFNSQNVAFISWTNSFHQFQMNKITSLGLRLMMRSKF